MPRPLDPQHRVSALFLKQHAPNAFYSVNIAALSSPWSPGTAPEGPAIEAAIVKMSRSRETRTRLTTPKSHQEFIKGTYRSRVLGTSEKVNFHLERARRPDICGHLARAC